MDVFSDIELQDCPICHGPALLEEESSWCFYVSCLDCGCHTAEVSFSKNEDRFEAASKAAHQWNIGKVLQSTPGE